MLGQIVLDANHHDFVATGAVFRDPMVHHTVYIDRLRSRAQAQKTSVPTHLLCQILDGTDRGLEALIEDAEGGEKLVGGLGIER